MKTKIDCGCEKDVFVCREHYKPHHTPPPDYGNFDEALMNAPEITQAQRENIVRAVNCHEEMLRLLKEFIKDQDCYCQLDKSVGAVGVCPIHEAIEAIAKAEGK